MPYDLSKWNFAGVQSVSTFVTIPASKTVMTTIGHVGDHTTRSLIPSSVPGEGPAMRVVIVDDEPLARSLLRTYCEAEGDLEIVGECSNGLEAIASIEKLHPDLVLLDVQMPLATGFDVVDAVGFDRMPPTIFVTAFDEFAVRAFEAQAVDFLLKPLQRERFQLSVARIRRLAGGGDSALKQKLADVLAVVGRQMPDRLVVRSGGKYVFIDVEKIERIESDQNYLTLFVGGKQYLHRSTMNMIEQRLRPDLFLRIHRSIIVNVLRIAAIQPYSGNEYHVHMDDGAVLLSSRTYRERIRGILRTPAQENEE